MVTSHQRRRSSRHPNGASGAPVLLGCGGDPAADDNAGVDAGSGAMPAVHSHEPDGTIHVEADSSGEVVTLGQLFTQWGVRLSSQQIGGARADQGQEVVVTSDGTPVAGDPGGLRLAPEQRIVLRLSNGAVR